MVLVQFRVRVPDVERFKAAAKTCARVTDLMAAAIPGSRTVFVEGGHFIDPGHPDVLRS